MAAPKGYHKLPPGVQCGCLAQWQERQEFSAELSYWCCGKDRQAMDLAAIKGREAEVRKAIARGEPLVDIGPFSIGQLGLSPVYVDGAGRLWAHRRPGVLELIND